MDERTKPLVSVIIPTHNRLAELSRALDSVLKQTLSSLEVFVLDDASKEDVESMVTKFSDSHVSYHRKDEKTNANVLVIMGISKAAAHCRRRLMDHIPFITFNQFRQLFRKNSAFTLPVRLLHFMTLIVLYTLRTNKLKP